MKQTTLAFFNTVSDELNLDSKSEDELNLDSTSQNEDQLNLDFTGQDENDESRPFLEKYPLPMKQAFDESYLGTAIRTGNYLAFVVSFDQYLEHLKRISSTDYTETEDFAELLCYITIKGTVDMLRYLLKSFKEINPNKPYNFTIYTSVNGLYNSIKPHEFNYETPPNTLLHFAIKSGNPRKVKLLLDRIDKQSAESNYYFNTILTRLNNYSDALFVCCLSLAYTDALYQPEEMVSPLCFAVKESNCKVVELLVARGHDINQIDSNQNTLLHHSVHNLKPEESLKITKFLVNKQLNIHAKNEDCRTPVYYAIISDKIATVTFLLDQGVDPNEISGDSHSRYTAYSDCYANSLLHYAAIYSSPPMLKILLSRGANPNVENSDEETPLALLMRNYSMMTPEYKKCYQTSAALLIFYGATVSVHLLAAWGEVYGNFPLKRVIQKAESMKGGIMWKMWTMEKVEYNSYIQWLPREPLEDTLLLPERTPTPPRMTK